LEEKENEFRGGKKKRWKKRSFRHKKGRKREKNPQNKWIGRNFGSPQGKSGIGRGEGSGRKCPIRSSERAKEDSGESFEYRKEPSIGDRFQAENCRKEWSG